MPIRCVLFDFDGVIADTEERNADYLAAALAHFGVRLTRRGSEHTGGHQRSLSA